MHDIFEASERRRTESLENYTGPNLGLTNIFDFDMFKMHCLVPNLLFCFLTYARIRCPFSALYLPKPFDALLLPLYFLPTKKD